MELIVIPDIHLKPWMFEEASEIMEKNGISCAVCLMDIADDWGQDTNLSLYSETYDAAISFSKDYPRTFWCYGNHDISYIWEKSESGYSDLAQPVVKEKIYELMASLPDPRQLAFVHRADNVIFSHGGLADLFVKRFVPLRYYDDPDIVLEVINSLGPYDLWRDMSPLWLRPQFEPVRMYKSRDLLQVVGHTPVKTVNKKKNYISCDVFSTYRNGRPYGSQEFLIIDTVSCKYRCVRAQRDEVKQNET